MSWNIQGLYEKLSFDAIGSLISPYDIIFLSETWCHPDQNITLPNYDVINMPRHFNHPNAPHCFGGMIALIKSDISKGIHVIAKQCDHMCILMLDKSFFKLCTNYYIIGVYFNPYESTYKCETCSGDYFNQLESFISSHEDEGEFMISGDLNARTGLVPDYIEPEIISFTTDSDDFCVATNHINFPSNLNSNIPRFSRDKHCVNIHGQELLRLCKNTNIRILNGRYGNDKEIGDFTCIKTNGKSLIDYMLCSPIITQNQSNFTIHEKQPESDHKPISISLLVGNISPEEVQQYDKYSCFKWDQSKLDEIKQTLCDPNNPCLQQFLDSMVMNCSSGSVASYFDNYICDALEKHVKLKCYKSRSDFPTNEWYDEECKRARKMIKNCNENPTELYNAEKEYKRITQSKQRQHKSKIVESLNSESDTSKMWSILHKLKPKDTKIPPISPDTFHTAFDSITYNEPSFDKKFENECLDFLNKFDDKASPKCDITSELLNSHFTQIELDAALMSLKDKKSSGIDGVPSEIFKYTEDVLGDTILSLANYVLEKGVYPEKWAEGLISPVHKAGSWNDVNNYRRITVQPAISKIIDTMINNRLVFLTDALNKDDIYNGGFKKGSSTTDNMFVLLSVIQRQKVLGKPLYIAFIDYRRAFDSVNRTLLFYKLIKSGYHGKLITLIKNMYSKTKSRVKIKNLLSDFLTETHGVNQGGVSSPFLFKAFLADFKQYLNTKCGINMSSGEILTHILWADDLILLAESVEELQILLNNVSDYCKRWQLLVNLSKSKIMIINGKQQNSIFMYNDTPLEIIHKYKYLGVIFSDGTNHFQDHIAYTETVANRAIFSVQGYLYSLNQTPPPISMKLFDTLVAPIIEYGSEIWSMCSSYDSLETLYLRFLKCSLGVRPQTPTAAILGDLGRYPLHVRLQVKAVKFWCKLVSKPSGSLPNIAYKMLLSLKDFGFPTWLDRISEILHKCELAHVFESMSFSAPEMNSLTSQIRVKLQEQFIERWHTEISMLPKLRTYKLFKSTFETEKYLFIFNKNHRQALSRFRLSAHTLEIEKGRWRRKLVNGKWRSYKTPIEERLCIFCPNNDVETEFHVLMTCTRYSDLRLDLFDTAKTFIANFDNLNADNKFIAMLQCDETSLTHQIAKCIYQIFKRRVDHVNTGHESIL